VTAARGAGGGVVKELCRCRPLVAECCVALQVLGRLAAKAFRNPVPGVGDLGLAVGRGPAIGPEVDEDDRIDREDALAREEVTHLGAHGDRRLSEGDRAQAHLDDVALLGGADEVDLGDVLRHDPLVAELNHDVDGGFLVDPAQQAPAEEGAVGIEILRPHPLAGAEVDVVAIAGHVLSLVIPKAPPAGREPGLRACGARLGVVEGLADKQATAALRRITGQVREYAWGSHDAIHRFLGTEPTGRPLAEIWFGTHPSAPALLADGPFPDLAALLASDPMTTLGPEVTRRFGPELPFLLKIIAPAAPLSLQAHPTLERARAGFAKEEAAGIPRDHPARGYRDPNHKPELFYALQHSELLVGFRRLTETLEILDKVPAPLAEQLSRRLRTEGVDHGLRWLLHRNPGEQAIKEFIETCHDIAVSTGRGAVAVREPSELLLKAAEIVSTLARHHPTDPATVAAVLLNPMVIEAGEALYVPSGTLHAHILGIGVEVMASSDNVLRAGLTPKHVDIGETLSCLDFDMGPASCVAPQRIGSTDIFSVPVADFELSVTELNDGVRQIALPGGGPRVLLCLDGAVAVGMGDGTRSTAASPHQWIELRRGEAAFAPAAAGELWAKGHGRLVQADVPTP